MLDRTDLASEFFRVFCLFMAIHTRSMTADSEFPHSARTPSTPAVGDGGAGVRTTFTVAHRATTCSASSATPRLAGLVSELEEDRGQGEVEQDAQGQESRGECLASGGVESDAQSELSGCLLAPATFAIGCAESDHGDPGAPGHKLARIVYNLMRYGLAYMRQSEEAYAKQVAERLEKQLRRRAKELGYTLIPTPPTPEQPTAA